MKTNPPIAAAALAATTQPAFLTQTNAARFALGGLFGLSQFGVNYTRIPPGAISALRHAHSHQDEAVFILSGRPTLRTDEGETELQPGMFVGFKAGTGNAHQLVNRTEEDVICIEVGDRNPNDQATYPDDDPAVVRAALGLA